MKAESVLTDSDIYRTEAFKTVLNVIKEKNNRLKLEIAKDESIQSNKLHYYCIIDDINNYINNSLL